MNDKITQEFCGAKKKWLIASALFKKWSATKSNEGALEKESFP